MGIQPRRCRRASCGRSLEGRRPEARYCSDRCRLLGWAAGRVARPHRRRAPRTWDVVDPGAVPREFLAVVARRVDRALAEGREVPGIRRRSDER